jgi:hypothetical protein
MPIVKKRNQQTESRLLLEADEPVVLPPAEVEDAAVILQFEKFKPYVSELLEALRAGATVETVPVMMDGSTFAVHCATRTFWVKLWHAAHSERARIERVQIISCLPSTRGMQILFEPDDDDQTDAVLDEEDADETED